MRPRRPMRRVSERKQEQRAERQRVVDAAFRRDRWACVAVKLVPSVECGGPLDPHERIPRSAWPGGELVLDNVLTVCRAHHRWVDHHPDDAHALGLHGYSWEVPER